jgi:hypothetical protein
MRRACIRVVPAGLVEWPGADPFPPPGDRERVELEPHNS